MNRQQAVAFIQYLQRCVSIIPTTGAEWDMMRGALTAIEEVANGKYELAPKSESPKE